MTSAENSKSTVTIFLNTEKKYLKDQEYTARVFLNVNFHA